MNRRRPWTTGEEEDLRELRARGASMTLISARLRRSRSAIKARVSLLGLRAVSRLDEEAITVPAADGLVDHHRVSDRYQAEQGP